MISFLSGKLQKEIAFLLCNTFCLSLYASLRTAPYESAYHSVRSGKGAATTVVSPVALPVHTAMLENTEKHKGKTVPFPPGNAAPEEDMGGPGQPEMQSFQSANANNMVDLFSGDFSYNIPLLDVGGYPVNLHYNSGISMDQEASWVGLGWNINPGTISRNMRGVPDEFNGKDSIRKTLNMKDNITVGVTADLHPEMLGFELNKIGKLSTGLSYNNYTGPSWEVGLSPTINSGKFALGDKTFGIDTVNTDLRLKLSSSTGFSAQPTFSAALLNKESQINGTGTVGLNFNSRSGLQDLTMTARGPQKAESDVKTQRFLPFSSSITFARTATVPKVTIPFTSFQFSFRVKAGGALFGFHPLAAVGGYYSQQYIKSEDTTSVLPAYGYMHYQAGSKDPLALLDFNRESDLPYSKKLPHIGLPVYTYDTYSISAEGTGGMFRPYRGDVGIVSDHAMKTRNHSGNLSVDLGGGNLAHFGADLSYNYSFTANQKWETENALKNILGFREADTTFEAVYFRNPSEKTTNTKAFYEAMGNSDLVRVKLGSSFALPQATTQLVKYNSQKKTNGSLQVTSGMVKTNRDKRAQVISYLTAGEASTVGLDTAINIYPYNGFVYCTPCKDSTVIIPNTSDSSSASSTDSVAPTVSAPVPSVSTPPAKVCFVVSKDPRVNAIRKTHHISQITVLNPDGRTYVYGIPAYNRIQKDVTFSVDKSNAVDKSTGTVQYAPGLDNSTKNKKGKDQFFSSEEVPAYAHSFLLTGLLSPDYIDVKGDGITEDDKGDAIKFNYTRRYDFANLYKWRTPYLANTATYNEGLRSDNSDDKGSYVYGEKEVWYLHSVESKTMVATFWLEDRNDGKGVLGENGGMNTNAGLQRLKEIRLYAKKDLVKYGQDDAKPIKTVHFSYSYKLCPGVENAVSGGKLTLDSVWFSYNRNEKGRANPYVFRYHANPSYQKRAYDRWGTYKPDEDNPVLGLKNDEFPYAVQNSEKANANSSAWTLDTVYTPSGGKMVVDYEADDYAYVQNRRAMQMVRLMGFSSDASFSNGKEQLYSGFNDYSYALLELPYPVASREEFYQRYLEGNTKLYFRVYVRMPRDAYGSGYEFVPCYVEYEDYNIEASGSRKAWIRLKPEKGMNPVMYAAMQFLRLNLPSKAYPGSDLGNLSVAAAAVRSLFSMVSNLGEIVSSFETRMRIKGWVREIEAAKSYVRLNNPVYKKLGGGLRVKRITLYDNWKKMSGQKEAVYGQEYRYTTEKVIAGKQTVISSGVATYEPSIGNEENPFHVPLEYTESYSLLGPGNNKYIDNPVGETYFPAPSVGYSKVRVTSINRKNIRSANGFEETEFYTAYDFPVVSDFTPFDKSSRVSFNSPLSLFISDARHYTTVSQGFKIELNDMHGKLKAQASYAETDSLNPISYTQNYYRVENPHVQHFTLNNSVPVLDSANGHVKEDGLIGKDIELMADLREQKSQTLGANIQVNGDIFILPIAIFPVILKIPSFIPKPTHAVNIYRAASLMKVVTSYGILDSVVHFEKGSTVAVKNMVYDQETGEPLLVRTHNAFKDPVYTFTYPSHWAYEGVGPAYKNIGTIWNQSFLISNGQLGTTGKFFSHGDEVMAFGLRDSFNCHTLGVPFVNKKLWVIDGEKFGRSNDLYLIDENGRTFSGLLLNLKTIRSGRRNMGSAVGTVTTLKNPLQLLAGQWRIALNDSSKVLSAAALQMREDWQIDSTVSCGADTSASINPFLHGLLGNWRTNRSYTYYGQRAENSPDQQTNIRKDGTFADFKPFWSFSSQNIVATSDTTRWVWNSEITMVNRKGFEVENKDPLGRYNAGVYGYNHALPVAVVQNARYRETAFEGFEDYIDYKQCDLSCPVVSRNHFSNPTLDSTQHHTGKYSLRVAANANTAITIPLASDSSGNLFFKSETKTRTPLTPCSYGAVGASGENAIPPFSPLPGSKMLLSAWVKEDRDCNCEAYTQNKITIAITSAPDQDIITYDLIPSGNIIDGWQRYENTVNIPLGARSITIQFTAPSATAAYFDDFRMHPFSANLKSFVYHPTNLRLMAELDENNYATFYEYDDEGTLVRMKKETEKGIKTVKESRTALLK